MGGLVFTVFAAIYYWGPKMTGSLQRAAGQDPLLDAVHRLQLHLRAAVRAGLMGQPRRVVTYPTNLQALNDWVSVSAFCIGLSMLVFLYNLIWSMVVKREPSRPTRGTPSRPSSSCPRRCRCTTSTASRCSTPIRIRTGGAGAGAGPDGAGSVTWKAQPPHPPIRPSSSSRRSGSPARCAPVPAACAARRLLHGLVRLRLLLPARAGSQQGLEDRPRRAVAGPGAHILLVLVASAVAMRGGREPSRADSQRRRRRIGAGAPVGRAPGHRVDDARLRPGQRRLRERVRRLDRVVRGPHRCACVFWIETQVATLAPAARGGCGHAGRGARPIRRSWRPASRPARSSGRSMSPNGSCCSCSSTCSRRWAQDGGTGDELAWLVGPAPAPLRGSGRDAVLRRRRRVPALGRQGLRAASFAAGLLTIVLALESPIDGYADQLFWVHMSSTCCCSPWPRR